MPNWLFNRGCQPILEMAKFARIRKNISSDNNLVGNTSNIKLFS